VVVVGGTGGEEPTYATATSEHLNTMTYNWEDHPTYHRPGPATGETPDQ